MEKPKRLLPIIIAVAVILLLGVGAYFAFTVGAKVFQKDDNGTPSDGDNNNNNTKPNKPPVARLSINSTTVEVGDIVVFNATNSKDDKANETSNGIVRYVWDFGDGSTPSETTEPQAEHVYNTPNTYNITLTVFDSDYASDTDKGSIKVVWPEEAINLGPAVLLGEPIFQSLGVISNYTEMTWEVRSEAKEMNITVTVAGANFRATQTNEVSVLLLDPEGNLVNNKTVAVMGSTQIIWDFEAADLTTMGDWMLQVTCDKGASYITVQGYVSYI